MLRKAQERVRECGLRQVAGLCVMDAARLGAADASFDAVVAPYVITVVPDPETTLDELVRVVRDGGEVVLVNHIGAETGPRAAFEKWLARQTRHLGWRPEFPWATIGDWCVRARQRRDDRAPPCRPVRAVHPDPAAQAPGHGKAGSGGGVTFGRNSRRSVALRRFRPYIAWT